MNFNSDSSDTSSCCMRGCCVHALVLSAAKHDSQDLVMNHHCGSVDKQQKGSKRQIWIIAFYQHFEEF